MNELQLARRHATLRWVGVPLFIIGAMGLVAAIGLGVQGAGWGGVMRWVAATGLGLGTFGIHNDTALAYAGRLRPADPALSAELAEEPREEIAHLRASPGAALVITLAALAASAWGMLWIKEAF